MCHSEWLFRSRDTHSKSLESVYDIFFFLIQGKIQKGNPFQLININWSVTMYEQVNISSTVCKQCVFAHVALNVIYQIDILSVFPNNYNIANYSSYYNWLIHMQSRCRVLVLINHDWNINWVPAYVEHDAMLIEINGC